MKKQYFKYLLVGIFLIFGSANVYSQVPTLSFTALKGSAPGVLLANGTNYVVFGLQMVVSGVTNYPANYIQINQLTITTSVTQNGFIQSGQLYQTTVANPALALSGTPIGALNVGQDLYVSAVNPGNQPHINNGTYYFYLAVNISNLQNPPPPSVTLSLVNPPASAVYFNNGSNPAPTQSVTNLTTPATFVFGEYFDWSGASDTRWNNSANWKINGNSSGVVPGTNDVAQIGVVSYTNVNNQPTPMIPSDIGTVIIGTNNAPKIILTSTLAIHHGLILNASSSLTLAGTSTLTLSETSTANSGSTLSITGGSTLTNNGTFTLARSTLNVAKGTFNNTRTVTVGPSCIINLPDPTANITNTGTFTLQSSADASTTISAITPGATITGNISVERYLTGGSPTYRGYRVLSSPVSTAQGSGIYSINYIKASSLVVGTKGTTGGFDKGGNPTFFLYRPNIAPSNTSFITGNFRGISDISANPSYSLDNETGSFNIPIGNGFFFFFRGDRTNNLANKYTPGTSAESVTLTTTGSVNIGPVTVKQWFTPGSSFLDYTSVTGNALIRGFALVGNPFPSSINWDTFSTTSTGAGIYGPNVSSSMYIYDPVSKNYSVYIAGNAGAGTIARANANVIPSGQGFFVRATAANAQLVFNEAAKTSLQANATTGNLFLGTPVQAAVSQYLRLTLALDSINTDGTIIRFNGSVKPDYDKTADAIYNVGNGLESLSSISADSVALAIYTLPLPKQTATTIGLNVNAVNNGTYKLSLTARKGIPELFDLWLMDAYKKDSTDLRHTPSYSFSILKSDSASYGSKRFSLVIRQNLALGVQLLSFNATKASNGASIVWKTLHEQNFTDFTIERSLNDGRTFNVIGSVASSGLETYSFLDKGPLNGADKYRLKLEDLNGTVIYSNVVTLNYTNPGDNFANISIYPNPVATTINLQIISTRNDSRTVPAGGFAATATQKPLSYDIEIINITGSTVKTAIISEPDWHTDISTLLPGTYIIQVINNNDNSLVGKSTFIKL